MLVEVSSVFWKKRVKPRERINLLTSINLCLQWVVSDEKGKAL